MDLGWIDLRTPPRVSESQLRNCAARRICIIKPSALGDVVQTLPLLGVLRRKFPHAAISWVVNRPFAELLDGHPYLSEVIPFDRHGSITGFIRLLAQLRRRRFDLVFDLQGLLRSAVMTQATCAPLRVGLETSREGAWLACHGLIPGTGREVAARLRCRRIAEFLGMPDAPWEARVPVPATARTWAADRLARLPRPILAIHAGAGWETKRWPVEKFAAIARRFGGSVVAVGSTNETSLAAHIVDSKTALGGLALDLAGRTTLPQLAAVLGDVDLLLSNDSGPLHLAASLGTPTVGIYTCTSAELSGPDASVHEFVSTTVGCAASYCKRCPNSGAARLACLDEVSVERVWAAVERVLDRQNKHRRSA